MLLLCILTIYPCDRLTMQSISRANYRLLHESYNKRHGGKNKVKFLESCDDED